MAQGPVKFHDIKQDMWSNDPGTAAWDQFSRFKYVFPHYNQQPSPKKWMDTMIGLQLDEDWSQLHKHLLHYKDSQLDFQVANYSYIHHVLFNRDMIVVKLSEYINNVPTQGGSGIKASAHSSLAEHVVLLDVCDVSDHFNGSYTISCRSYGTCVQIAVLLQYVDYNAYKRPAVNIVHPVLNRSVCKQENLDTEHFRSNKQAYKDSLRHIPYIDTLHHAPYKEVLHHTQGWYMSHGKLLYQSAKYGKFPPENIANSCQKLSQYDKVFMAGASHMRLLYHYYKENCKNYHQFMYTYFRYVDQLPAVVDGFIKQVKQNNHKSFVFLVQTGIWNLCCPSTSYQEIFTTEINRYMSSLAKLSEFGLQRKRGHVHIHIVTTPARNDQRTHLVSCNNFVAALFNKILQMRVDKLRNILLETKHSETDSVNKQDTVIDAVNSVHKETDSVDKMNAKPDHLGQTHKETDRVIVGFTDMFQLTLPVSTHTMGDQVHYIECDKGKWTNCRGGPGTIIGQIILNAITDQ